MPPERGRSLHLEANAEWGVWGQSKSQSQVGGVSSCQRSTAREEGSEKLECTSSSSGYADFDFETDDSNEEKFDNLSAVYIRSLI